MSQLRKKFTNDQVKELIERYALLILKLCTFKIQLTPLHITPLNISDVSEQVYKCIVVPEAFKINASGKAFSNSWAAFKPVQ